MALQRPANAGSAGSNVTASLLMFPAKFPVAGKSETGSQMTASTAKNFNEDSHLAVAVFFCACRHIPKIGVFGIWRALAGSPNTDSNRDS
jgi:hypothetical protein